MAGEANITDVTALEEFRRALIRFREEIGVAIAEAGPKVDLPRERPTCAVVAPAFEQLAAGFGEFGRLLFRFGEIFFARLAHHFTTAFARNNIRIGE